MPSLCRRAPRTRATTGCSTARSFGSPTARNPTSSFIIATVDPAAGYKGITAFLVEKDFPGFSVGKKEDKLGIRASSTTELILDDCKVPKENLLGEVGKGYKIAIETLNEGRIGIGAQMLGLAQGAWECAAKYAQERKQFGQPLTNFQAVAFQLAQMATEITARPPDGLQRCAHEGCRSAIS